jgi:glycosyltransferase involved in cell wall biosynthesis
MSKIDVLYYSCPFDLSGYGSVARNHLVEMDKINGLNVRLRTRKFWTGVSPDLKGVGDILHRLERNPIGDRGFIFIQHLTPENFYIDPRAAHHICYTPFETDSAPLSWMLPLRGMDEIWVPSEHNKQAYIRAGLKAEKIFVIPHGIDEKRFNPSVAKLEYNRGKFNFGSVFDWTERKNPVALIRAYFNAFQNGEDVSLTIRTFWRFPIEKTKEYIKNEVDKIKNGFEGTRDFPKILFWFDSMEEELMPSFYRSLDCFVLPTRGEGFGLPFLEAMACGVPTIGPKWGGNTEFMKEENSVLVNGKVILIENAEFLQRQPQYAGQRWFDIDEGELSKAMRFVYDNKDKCQESAMATSEYVRSNMTWEQTAKKIHNRLGEISGEVERSIVSDSNFMTGVQ